MSFTKVLPILMLSTGCFLMGGDKEPAVKSIAVFPFESLDAQKPNAGLGASDSVLTRLVAAGASMVSKAQLEEATAGQIVRSAKARSLGKELGAAWVVVGTVDFVGDEVAVSAQVLDVARNKEVVSERVHGPVGDTFRHYDDIASAVVAKMAAIIPTLRIADDPQNDDEDIDTDFHFDDGDEELPSPTTTTKHRKAHQEPAKAPRSPATEEQETTELIELGIKQHKRGDLRGAVKLLRRAVERSPRSARAKVALGHALIARRDYGGAQMVLQKAVNLDPNNVAAWTFLGYAKDKSGSPESGRKDYRRALRANDGYALAHYYLAANLYNAGEPLEARTHCKKAAKLGNRKARALLPRIDRKIRKMKD